ncbi:hypothetical protein [Micromonospora sp. CPCC 205561]|uniref:hypothetical protein n=1 Tax=Micromonospora sp. CPCC 205561 TaxID=3122407 RepID=UPI002FF3192F
MSDATIDRSDRLADRPDEVTDPLLWKLALDVADAHEPDGDGGCHNLLCAGQPWPCHAWNNAQRALHLARAEPGRPAAPAVGHGRQNTYAAGLPHHGRSAARTASAA